METPTKRPLVALKCYASHLLQPHVALLSGPYARALSSFPVHQGGRMQRLNLYSCLDISND